MNHKRPPVPAIIIVALLVIISAYFIITQTEDLVFRADCNSCERALELVRRARKTDHGRLRILEFIVQGR